MSGRHAQLVGALVLVLGCGGSSEAAPASSSPEPSADPSPRPNAWDLRIEVQFVVDESLGTVVELDPWRLRDFRYERRGDVGDGTEEVIACTGTLPDAEHEALEAALALRSWSDGEPFTVSVPGGAGPEAQWLVMRQELEGHTPIPYVPPSEDAVRAMVPTLDRILRAIREADGSWSSCSTRLDPPGGEPL